jgi:hypothetical protein
MSQVLVHLLTYSDMQAEVEYDLLRRIQANVERLYQNGKPLHTLANAKSIEYVPASSQFFVTNAEAFRKIEPGAIQDIFRDRHIIVTGTDGERATFDGPGLLRLGSLVARRDIQGVYYYLAC